MWQIEVKYQAVGCNDFISEVVTVYTNQVQTVTKLVNLSVKTLIYSLSADP